VQEPEQKERKRVLKTTSTMIVIAAAAATISATKLTKTSYRPLLEKLTSELRVQLS